MIALVWLTGWWESSATICWRSSSRFTHFMLNFFTSSQKAIPHLKNSSHAHILNISPPLNMKPVWFKNHVGKCLPTTKFNIVKYLKIVKIRWNFTLISEMSCFKTAQDDSQIPKRSTSKPRLLKIHLIFPRFGQHTRWPNMVCPCAC